MKEFVNERRRYPRFELNVDARYTIVDYEEVFKKAVTRNISAEGLCFESGEELKHGMYAELEVDLKDGMPPICMVGEIKWSTQIKEKQYAQHKYINGVKLINIPISDEGRFLKYYCDRMVEKLAQYLEK